MARRKPLRTPSLPVARSPVRRTFMLKGEAVTDSHKMKWSDIKDIRRQLDYLYEKRNDWTYPIEILIEGFPMGARCWNADQLVWFHHGFEVAVGLREFETQHKTTKR